jgi:hypothetical protein
MMASIGHTHGDSRWIITLPGGRSVRQTAHTAREAFAAACGKLQQLNDGEPVAYNEVNFDRKDIRKNERRKKRLKLVRG